MAFASPRAEPVLLVSLDSKGYSTPDPDVHYHEDNTNVVLTTRPARLVPACLVLTGTLAGLTLALRKGFELESFPMDPRKQDITLHSSRNVTEAVDDWNSYSGNVVSALLSAWELALSYVMFATLTSLAPRVVLADSQNAKLTVFAVTSGCAWLISQGLTATNVQLQDRGVIPTIVDQDLFAVNNYQLSADQYVQAPTNGSAVANTDTLLRSAIVGTHALSKSNCSTIGAKAWEASASYAFSTSPWMRGMLAKGASSQQRSSTCKRSTMNVSRFSNLPFGIHDAAILAYYGVNMMETFLHEVRLNGSRRASILTKTESDSSSFEASVKDVIIDVAKKSTDVFDSYAINDMEFQFSRTHLGGQSGSNITFDAITIDMPIALRDLTCSLEVSSSFNDSTLDEKQGYPYFTNIDRWKKKNITEQVFEVDVWNSCSSKGCRLELFDYYASQVRAIQLCMNEDGRDDPIATMSGCRDPEADELFMTIANKESRMALGAGKKFATYKTTNSSALVFSFAKRFSGDEFAVGNIPSADTARAALAASQKKDFIGNITDEMVERQRHKMRKAYLHNLRGVFSFTIGRIHWQVDDLGSIYGAECQTTSRQCSGLQYTLQNGQHLILGAEYVPIPVLRDFAPKSNMWTPLARVSLGKPGDYVFPENFKSENLTALAFETSDCRASEDEQLTSVLQNHYYSEDSLQAAYTASMFWLFKYGSVRDVLPMSSMRSASLEFVENIPLKAIFLSTPTKSAIYTLVGCGCVLMAALLATVWSKCGRRGQLQCLTPSGAVKVLGQRVPQAFVRVTFASDALLESGHAHHGDDSVHDFEIDSVVLQHKVDPDNRKHL